MLLEGMSQGVSTVEPFDKGSRVPISKRVNPFLAKPLPLDTSNMSQYPSMMPVCNYLKDWRQPENIVGGQYRPRGDNYFKYLNLNMGISHELSRQKFELNLKNEIRLRKQKSEARRFRNERFRVFRPSFFPQQAIHFSVILKFKVLHCSKFAQKRQR